MSKPRILVVEPNEKEALVLLQLLKENGYEVIIDQTLEKGASKFPGTESDATNPFSFSLVLADLFFAFEQKLKIAESLTKKAAACRVPVVVLTGQGDLKFAIMATKWGTKDFVTKPYDDRDLLATIARVLSSN